MTLRELIEAKHRRTATLPLLVGDLSSASREVATLRAALQVQQEQRAAGSKPTKAEQGTQKALAEALERQSSCVVEIQLRSLPDHEWDALFGDLEPGDDGELDLSSIHAPLLAASCVDEELQDADWWAGELDKPHWSKGDRAAISQALLDLNLMTPVKAPGKD